MGRTAVVVMLGLLLTACGGTFGGFGDGIVGSGTGGSEDRAIDAFDAIRLEGIGDVSVSVGGDHSVTVETDDNLIDRIVTDVRSGTLVIAVEPGVVITPRSGLTITVTTEELSEVVITGAGQVVVGPLDTTDFGIEVSGVGAVDVSDLTADTLTVELSGAGDIDVSGEATRQVVELSGVGSYDGGDLRSSEVDVDASGAGSVEVWAVDTLTATVSGVGSVSYWGSPSTRIDTSGVGDVEALGDR